MTKSTFTMPAAGTAEFEQLKARWSDRPISFGQCGMLKSLFKSVSNNGGWKGKVSPAIAKRLEFLSQRTEDGRWTMLRTDSGELTMWDAHQLAELLNTLNAGSPVTVSKQAAKPAPEKSRQHFSEVDEMKIASLMELTDMSRSDAIENLVNRGKIAAPSISETIVKPAPGVYETTEGFRFQVKEVATRGNGTRLSVTCVL